MQRQARIQGISALTEEQNKRLEAKNRARIASNKVLTLLGQESGECGCSSRHASAKHTHALAGLDGDNVGHGCHVCFMGTCLRVDHTRDDGGGPASTADTVFGRHQGNWGI